MRMDIEAAMADESVIKKMLQKQKESALTETIENYQNFEKV